MKGVVHRYDELFEAVELLEEIDKEYATGPEGYETHLAFDVVITELKARKEKLAVRLVDMREGCGYVD